jgi:hypothetical protein
MKKMIVQIPKNLDMPLHARTPSRVRHEKAVQTTIFDKALRENRSGDVKSLLIQKTGQSSRLSRSQVLEEFKKEIRIC